MTSKVSKQDFQPPFELDESSRRKYILRRVRGVPVPPYPSLSRGETPYDLIAAWILDSSVPWAKDMRNDLHYLLQESLDKINPSMDNTEFWELGGLLALAARLRDKKSRKIAASFMAGSGGELLSNRFMSIFDRDGLYDKVGTLMYKVLDMTLPASDTALFEAGIKVALSSCEAASLLSTVARRNPSKAKGLAPEIIKHCYNELDQDTLVYVIRLLREAFWAKDNNKSLTGIRDMFMKERREFREYAADALEIVFPNWYGKLYARELREARLAGSEFRERANPDLCHWQRDAA